MRALLVLMFVVLISGCSTTVEERYANCLKMQAEKGPELVWIPSQGRCQFVDQHTRGAEPIIDKGTDSFDPTKYAADLTACRGYANQVAGQAAGGVVTGAILGAMYGAIIDDSFDTSGATSAGAMTGALGGGVQGSANTQQGRALVVRKCLAGRGYSVLDM